jgi:hypothetical protein
MNSSSFLNISNEEAWMEWSDASNPDTDYASGGWNWTFDFPNGTGYYEFYSIGKKTGSTDETPPNVADAICQLKDFSPPEIGIITVDNESVGYGFNVTVNVSVWDNETGVSSVKCNVTYPDSTWYNFTMINTDGQYYEKEINLTDTWQLGWHNYTIFATDGTYENTSSQYSFNVSAQCNVSVQTTEDEYDMNEFVNLTSISISGGSYTFGKTGTQIKVGAPDTVVGTARLSPANSGTADSITVYLQDWDNGDKVKCALYEDDGVGGETYLGETEERSSGGADGWHTFNFSTVIDIDSSKQYCIVFCSDSDVSGNYKIESGYYIIDGCSYGSLWPDDLGIDSGANFAIYCSYTESSQADSEINNTGDTNNSGYLLMQIQYNDSGTWIVEDDTINETTPRTINSSEYLELQDIFNGIVNTSVNLSHGSGVYRVYVALRDPNGNVLINDDSTYMNASYEFTYVVNETIEITPATWDIGTTTVGEYNASTGPYFNLTNEGNTALDIQINASNATNSTTGATWLINDTAGYDKYTIGFNLTGGDTWTLFNDTFKTFVTDIAASSYQTFDLNVTMATKSTKSDPLELTVTFRAVAS